MRFLKCKELKQANFTGERASADDEATSDYPEVLKGIIDEGGYSFLLIYNVMKWHCTTRQCQREHTFQNTTNRPKEKDGQKCQKEGKRPRNSLQIALHYGQCLQPPVLVSSYLRSSTETQVELDAREEVVMSDSETEDNPDTPPPPPANQDENNNYTTPPPATLPPAEIDSHSAFGRDRDSNVVTAQQVPGLQELMLQEAQEAHSSIEQQDLIEILERVNEADAAL
ncbi:hypothetical protein Pcinc_005667 [Petrolisthes cinctipes]|uniref:Uncharacterized protein n=1 Tax=Petrolisthes cinctipes TaxID=88211 RepID=A0AAE1GC62_PETCI|nr:hypothetical protein Pcinc_005667 [Petrolisthes cinctipes]